VGVQDNTQGRSNTHTAILHKTQGTLQHKTQGRQLKTQRGAQDTKERNTVSMHPPLPTVGIRVRTGSRLCV